MKLKRRPNWRSALVAEIEAHRREPFAWGTRDCALFAADCVRAMVGIDLAAGFRGRYTSERSALEVIAEVGADDLPGLAASLLPEIEPRHARLGDIAAMRASDGRWSLGIVNGAVIMVLRPDGVGTVPFGAAVRAFRV